MAGAGERGWCSMIPPWLNVPRMCFRGPQASVMGQPITYNSEPWRWDGSSPDSPWKNRGPRMAATPPADMMCFEGENHRCWLPLVPPGPPVPLRRGPHTLYRSLEDYKPFEHISRTVHFSEYENIVEEGLKPKKIKPEHYTYLTIIQKNVHCLFFGIPGESDAHDWYGNVRMQVEFKKILEEMHFRVYFVDVVDFKVSSVSRLLLTTRKYDDHLPKYDPSILGGPWYRDPSGKDYCLTNARRFNSTNRNHHGHELEFLVELSKDEYQRLFSCCDKLAANHSRANTSEAKACMRYNSFSKSCPSPWSAEEMEEKMKCLAIKNTGFATTCDRIEKKDKNRE